MSKDWRQRPEAGNSLGLRLTSWFALSLGRRCIAVLLVPITFYFVLVRGVERRASRKFLTRALNKRASLLDVYRHFYCFARATVDRVYLLDKQAARVPISLHAADEVDALAATDTGGVLLVAHMGSFEVARSIAADDLGLNVRLVLDRAISQRLIDALEIHSPEFAANIIDANQAQANLGLLIADALRAKAWVGFMGDRYNPGDRSASCQFMGAPALIPLGPFLIAMVMNAPIVAIFTVFRNGRHEVFREIIANGAAVARQDRAAYLAEVAQHYADRLEYFARMSPYSWFNFFDFWNEEQ